MNKPLWLLLLWLPAARTASAEPSRDLVRVAVRTELGPGAEAPTKARTLTNKHLNDLSRFLIPNPERPPKNLPPALIGRLGSVLYNVDQYYKRALPPDEWERRLKDMRKSFVARNGGPAAAAKMSRDRWEEAIDEMISGFVAGLGDRHTTYYNRRKSREFLATNQGRLTGIGVHIYRLADSDEIKLVVLPDSPAKRAGLVDGDVITGIDGRPIQGLKIQAVADLLVGRAGEPVEIQLKRLDRPVAITRGEARIPNILVKMAAPGIGYVYFSHFTPDSDLDLFAKIDELKTAGAQKLILDLRHNPGGFTHVAQSIASEFLRGGETIMTTTRQGRLASKALADGPGRYEGMPLAVIINGTSASSSEILAAALQQHGRATIVGQVSCGKGSSQNMVQIKIPAPAENGKDVVLTEDGTILKITGTEWSPPNGRSIDGECDPEGKGRAYVPHSGGVEPDEPVSMDPDETKNALWNIARQLYGHPDGNIPDPALDKAVSVLSRPR